MTINTLSITSRTRVTYSLTSCVLHRYTVVCYIVIQLCVKSLYSCISEHFVWQSACLNQLNETTVFEYNLVWMKAIMLYVCSIYDMSCKVTVL